MKKSSPENRSANCRSTVGRQITDRLPTGYRQLTDRPPTVSQRRKFVVKTCSKHDPETITIPKNITYLPIDGKKDFFPRKLMICVADTSFANFVREDRQKYTELNTERQFIRTRVEIHLTPTETKDTTLKQTWQHYLLFLQGQLLKDTFTA